MKEEDQALIAELVRGGEMTFANAEQLFHEATLLRENNHYARAIFLHQIAMEECAKVEMIGAAATGLVMGHPVDLDALAKRFRDHKAKNFTNAYMADVVEAERLARDANDHTAASAAFKKSQAEIHAFLNTAKNSSMYVDLKDGRFVAPGDVITKELADQIAALGYFFMSTTVTRIRVLRRMINEPKVVAEWTRDFEKMLHALRERKATFKELEEATDLYMREQVAKFSQQPK